MEDLVPFLIFIVIAVINVLKFVAKKGKRKGPVPGSSAEVAPKRQPSSIEEFFEEITAKLEPEPTELPDWPESRERPNYVQEMEEFQQARDFPSEPEPEPDPQFQSLENPDEADLQTLEMSEALKSMKQASAGSLFSGAKAIRLPSIPMMRSSSRGRIDFNLKKRSNLKQAVIANIIFSQPRACDRTFNNTLAK